MKKLGKKIGVEKETIEAYYCSCTCFCTCSCTCTGTPELGSIIIANVSDSPYNSGKNCITSSPHT